MAIFFTPISQGGEEEELGEVWEVCERGMNYLSLFSGVEGGGLAFQHLIKPKLQCIGYVEIDDYCQRIIQQRILDGFLDRAPIFGDVKAFIDQGYAEAYKGMVDVLSAGFPCEAFSLAGKQLAEKDPRNMWPETIETIRIVKPTTVFLENVPGLFSNEYALTIFRDLRQNGYKALPPLKLGADDIGANHRRKRFWIVAYAHKKHGDDRRFYSSTISQFKKADLSGSEENVPDSNIRRSKPRNDHAGREAGSITIGRCEEADVANTNLCELWNESGRSCRSGRKNPSVVRNNGQKCQTIERAGWWDAEPRLGRVAHGVAHRVDRLEAIGKGQVPAVVEVAWEILSGH